MFAMEFVLWQICQLDGSKPRWSIQNRTCLITRKIWCFKSRSDSAQTTGDVTKTLTGPGSDLLSRLTQTRTAFPIRRAWRRAQRSLVFICTPWLRHAAFRRPLCNIHWAELEDKYTNPLDRKETLRHLQPGRTCWRWGCSFFCSTCGEPCTFLYPRMVRPSLFYPQTLLFSCILLQLHVLNMSFFCFFTAVSVSVSHLSTASTCQSWRRLSGH